MARLLIQYLEDELKAKLERRARQHGRTMEEEVREILTDSVRDDRGEEGGVREPLGSRLAARFADLGLTQGIPELRSEPEDDDLQP